MFEDRPPPDPVRLEARIREILARGVTVGPEAQGFIASTLPVFRPGDLATALAEACTAEIEPVVALLFFPDEGVQLELEESLAGRALSAEAEERLADRLAAFPPRVAFGFPVGGERLELEMTPERSRRFLMHLRLDRALPPGLDDAIAAALPLSDRHRFRVLWRNSRCPATEATVCFLGKLLRRADLRDRNGWACLGFILEFLAEGGDEADFHGRLVARKARLLNALARSRQQRAELARGNMEILISRGMRLVALDEEQARRDVACIDLACQAVYGRIEAIDIDTVTIYDSGH
jgi:hypothetical protein